MADPSVSAEALERLIDKLADTMDRDNARAMVEEAFADALAAQREALDKIKHLELQLRIEIDHSHQLSKEVAAQRELMMRADSYLSLLWYRPSQARDMDLTLNVERTIGDLRKATRS